MCVLSIKVHMRKKTGNLFNDPRILIVYNSFGCVVWHINHCRFINAKSSLCIYIKY